MIENLLHDLLARVKRIEDAIVKQSTIKAAYSTAEFAKIIDRDEYTVREHCRQGRLHASKKASGRGNHCEWSLSHEELIRYQSEGLLPFKRP